MLCKYRGVREPFRFKDFMEIAVGGLARKPVRARCKQAQPDMPTLLNVIMLT